MVDCFLAEIKTMNTVIHKSYPIDGYDKQKIDEYIWDFLKTNEIRKEIALHVIIDEPIHNNVIYNDELSSFAQYFKLNHGRTMRLSSIADMLVYKQWNMIGMKCESFEMKKKWAYSSRIAMLYISVDNVSVSMVDNGKIIDGMSIGLYAKEISHVYINRINPNNPFLPADRMSDYSNHIVNVIGMVYELTHADYIYVYMEPYVEIPKIDTGIIKTRFSDRTQPLSSDIIQAVIMSDITYEDEPYFIIAAKGDYQDVIITVEEDDGTIKEMPVFQH